MIKREILLESLIIQINFTNTTYICYTVCLLVGSLHLFLFCFLVQLVRLKCEMVETKL